MVIEGEWSAAPVTGRWPSDGWCRADIGGVGDRRLVRPDGMVPT